MFALDTAYTLIWGCPCLCVRFESAASLGEMAEDCPKCAGMGMRVIQESNGRRHAEECDCRHARKLAFASARARIPPKYELATLESYNTKFEGANPSLRTAHFQATCYADGYPVTMRRGEGLMFSGPSGLGKTHLAVGILKVLVKEKGCNGLFYYYQQLLKDIQSSWNPQSASSELQVLEPVFEAEVLVLDDLGSVRPTDWVWDTVSMVLNARYNQERVTIITTNFENLPAGAGGAGMTLGDRIGNRMYSRLLEMCQEVKMQGPDYRELLSRAPNRTPQFTDSNRGSNPHTRTAARSSEISRRRKSDPLD